MTYLNKVRLYQTPKNIMENVPVELLIQLYQIIERIFDEYSKFL